MNAPSSNSNLEDRVEVTYAFALKLNERRPGRYESGRLESAKALALSPTGLQEARQKYETTIWDCRCPDHAYRRMTCKHMIAVMLEGCIFN